MEDVTCDGQTILFRQHNDEHFAALSGDLGDAAAYWRFVARPRSGAIWAYHVSSGTATRVLSTEGVCPAHVEASPVDPGLIRYSPDSVETKSQRVWCVRLDGSDNHMIRPQAPGEMVTHEFWWSDGRHVGYTYQDRRGDPTVETIPLAEYAPAPTRLGIAAPDGREVYLSDPLNSYHTHLYVSPDGRYVSGEGTHDNLFVYAAPFAWDNPKLQMTRLASVHTPYRAFRGNYVNCDFSTDSRWLLYNDTINGKMQIFAVGVDA
jgi:hypothetical protein